MDTRDARAYLTLNEADPERRAAYLGIANGAADCVRMLAFGSLMLASDYQADEPGQLASGCPAGGLSAAPFDKRSILCYDYRTFNRSSAVSSQSLSQNRIETSLPSTVAGREVLLRLFWREDFYFAYAPGIRPLLRAREV